MQPLYKRLLLTLFPDEMKNADINPATMFISSLSTKEFFSLLSRKVTEYYKINGFDSGIETFEVKIGIGQEQGISIEKANDYYGYLIAAQYNGKGFFSPTFVGSHLSLYSATLLLPHLRSQGEESFAHLMVMIYLLPLLFVTKIKHFPQDNSHKKQYNWFVKLCRSTLILLSEDENIDVDAIIHALNMESTVLRNLFIICQQAENVFVSSDDPLDYWKWMLDEHLFDHDKKDISRFLGTYKTSALDTDYSAEEEEIIDLLLPTDFNISALYQGVNIFDIIQHIITPWYDSSITLQEYWTTLADEPHNRPLILREMSEITYTKKAFWSGVQQFITQYRTKNTSGVEEDMSEFMSAIEDGKEIDPDAVPESIKQESRMVDHIIHFYIGMIGSHRSAKNDTFWYRRTQSLPSIDTKNNSLESSNHHYRSKHLSLYDTNGFYYQRARDNVRQGKQRFHIPLRTSINYPTNDNYTKHQIIQSSLISLLSDTHQSRMRLTLHQEDIVDIFEKKYKKRIRSWIKKPKTLIKHYRGSIDAITGRSYSDIFTDISDIKNNSTHIIDGLYRLDMQLRGDVLYDIHNNQELCKLFQSFYDDTTLLVFLNELKNTLLGLMLWISHEQHHHKTDGGILWLTYVRDVLHIDPLLRSPLQDNIYRHINQNKVILKLWTQIDDNPGFLDLCSTMWHEFLSEKKHNLTTEDILRLHSTLQHISSYNIRYIIPE